MMYRINMYLEVMTKGLRRGTGWYGYVLEYVDGKGVTHTVDGFGQADEVTPNRLILIAFCAALSRVKHSSEIEVFTDKLYLRNFTEHLQEWKKNNWLNAAGREVKNLDLWQQAEAKAKGNLITFSSTYQHEYKNWLDAELARRARA